MSDSGSLKNEIRNFSPAYFALVMATGIISTGCKQLHYDGLAKFFFVLNNVQYLILLIVLISRLFLFFPQIKTDFSTHAKGAGFLTFVAGSCVLGTGYVQGKQMFSPGIVLLIIAFIAWLIIIYSFLLSVILQKKKPSLETGINGSWLLLIVSTQSLVILGTSLAQHLSIPLNITLFATLSAWLAGIILYAIFITIIVYRLTFYPVHPSEVSPSYWIDTGAAAISTVAGATLSGALAGVTIYQPYVPVINLFCLLFWAIATFWLPLLLVLETWRHVKAGFKYSAAYWSMVFPLGMFSVATLKLASALQTPFLHPIARIFIFIALTVWLIVFVGMAVKVLTTLFSGKGAEASAN
jgi:tellurite resistance protein TehA-like permease